MVSKEFIKANELVRDSFALAKKIYDSGYRPEVLLVLWRGGTPVGIVIHEFFAYRGLQTYHAAIKAESYRGIEKRIEPRVEHLDSVLDVVKKDSRVLVVDDIFDTGCTVKRVRAMLGKKTSNVKIATLYYKPGQNMTDIVPDFYMRETEHWVVFPHELMDLSPAEIRVKDEFIHRLVV